MAKMTLSKSLRAIAAALETLDPAQIEALIAEKGKLIYVAFDDADEKNTMQQPIFSHVIDDLAKCESREEAQKILGQLPNREALTALAKQLKVHIMKHDKREDIVNKIVEFSIGGRLRSAAIQTLNLRGGSGDN